MLEVALRIQGKVETDKQTNKKPLQMAKTNQPTEVQEMKIISKTVEGDTRFPNMQVRFPLCTNTFPSSRPLILPLFLHQ